MRIKPASGDHPMQCLYTFINNYRAAVLKSAAALFLCRLLFPILPGVRICDEATGGRVPRRHPAERRHDQRRNNTDPKIEQYSAPQLSYFP